MSFGEKLTKLRKEKGMSQEDLANNLNVSRQAVSKWESNNSYPETEKIVAICKLFDCSMDELIGLKEGKIKEENKTLSIINEYFDKFIRGIKMFYSMTFIQKIKCLFEMCFYGIILVILFVISLNIFTEIIRKLLYLLPYELLIILIQVFEGLYYLVFLIFSLYVLIKLYKVRYLDYYDSYLLEKKKNIDVVNNDVEVKTNDLKKLNVKEEKIIIRDPNNEFKPFAWIKKAITLFLKMMALLCSTALGMTFVLLVALLIFVLYFMSSGIIVFYVAGILLGALLGVYIFTEIFIKYIFNMKQSPKRLFAMFIMAMIIVGVSSGLFVSELTNFKVLNNPKFDTLVYKEEIEMQDDLIIRALQYTDTVVVFEERNNILIEMYGTSLNNNTIRTYKNTVSCSVDPYGETKKFKEYEYYNHYYGDFEGNEIIKYIINMIESKELVSEEYFYGTVAKVYISKENYEKIISNDAACNYYGYDE